MSKGSFRRALIEADRELARVPFAGERDVRAIVDRRRVSWRLPALALASALVVLFVMRTRDTSDMRGEHLALDVPGFGHVAGDRDARVTRISGGIEVVSGRVDVDVAHRPRGAAPALVRVSHGTIAVLGTRFTIEQSAHGGRVVLHEGKIRFDGEGRSVVLAPGESLTWPIAHVATTTVSAPPPVIAPTPAAPVEIEEPIKRATTRIATANEQPASKPPRAAITESPRAPITETPPAPITQPTPAPSTELSPAPITQPTPAPITQPAPAPITETPPAPITETPPALDIDQLLAELANLRARRRFTDAAALLETALAAALPATTLERLSYELGDIRTYQLTDRERACAHWRAHRARFPHGRYTDEVAAAVRRLACKEITP